MSNFIYDGVPIAKSFDEIDYLLNYASERYYQNIKLTLTTRKDFENKSYEEYLCHSIFKAMSSAPWVDPEYILLEFLLLKQYEHANFKTNKKRTDMIERQICIIYDLGDQLLKFRGEFKNERGE